MKKVCVLMANGFEEVEALTIIDVLRRSGLELTTIALEGQAAKGAHGVEVSTDATWAAAMETDWDLVVLPGGQPGSDTLRDSTKVHQLLKKQREADREVAAICAAPIALAAAGIISGKQVTCYPGFENQLGDANFVEDRVVRDDKLTTSRGPGTAMEFALSLVETMVGAAKRQELSSGMLVAAAS